HHPPGDPPGAAARLPDGRVPDAPRPGGHDRAPARAEGHAGLAARPPVVTEGWRQVELARHLQRPYALDYVGRITTTFHERRGDRLVGDDPALVGGLGAWRGTTAVFLGQQKGRSLRERVARNYGMMHPEGYRKAIRLAKLAARFGLPVISLIDTPGAYPGAAA